MAHNIFAFILDVIQAPITKEIYRKSYVFKNRLPLNYWDIRQPVYDYYNPEKETLTKFIFNIANSLAYLELNQKHE